MTGSLLDGLLARREELRLGKVKLLPVPSWENPSLAFRVHPVDGDVIGRLRRKADKNKADDAMTASDAALVAAAVEKVIIGGDTELSLKELADQLKLPEGTSAGDVVRRLCITDGDITALSRAVLDLSGFTEGVDAIDEAFAGE